MLHPLLVSYVLAEGSPQPFYAGFGFVETGEVNDGENVMKLDLRGHPRPLTHVVLMQFQEPTPTVLGRRPHCCAGCKGRFRSCAASRSGWMCCIQGDPTIWR